MTICEKCGREIPAGATYCPNCGAPVKPQAEAVPAPMLKIRPTTVTASAIIFWIFGFLAIFSGAYSILYGTATTNGTVVISTGAATTSIPADYYILTIIIGAIIGALEVVAGYGLWTLRRWGRTLTMVVAAYFVLDAVLALISSTNIGDLIYGGIFLLIYGLILWLMFRPEVKQVFAI
jgi:hypothetical protein